jgi:hypothetical protein
MEVAKSSAILAALRAGWFARQWLAFSIATRQDDVGLFFSICLLISGRLIVLKSCQ